MQRVGILLILAMLTAAPTEAAESVEVPAGAPGLFVPVEGVSTRPAETAESLEIFEEATEFSGPAAPQATAPQPDAVEVFHSSFEDAADTDLDGWPDGWVRKRGPEYPWYLKIGLQREPAADGKQALRIELDGSAGAVFSPPIAVQSQFSYVFAGSIKTAGLHHDAAYYTITFYDAKGTSVQRFTTEPLTHAPEWTRQTLGPLAVGSPEADHAIIGVHLMPGSRADLTGSASFDQISLHRLPSMTLSTSRPYNLYTDADDVEVWCHVSGVFEPEPEVVFQLLDREGRQVLEHTERLKGGAVPPTDPAAQGAFGLSDVATWKPHIPAPGFYRIQCALRCRKGLLLQREQTLVSIEPAASLQRGEFGWTLPKGEHPLPLSALERILPEMGIHWVKLPLWVSDADTHRLDQLVAFAERMSRRGIETVGLLCDPPTDVRSQFGEAAALQAADIFTTEPELWYPLLEPVMARLALQVRWWQLGQDGDVSFVGYPKLLQAIARIKAELQRFGQEVNLGIGWRMLDQQVASPTPPWSFLALTAQPQLTADELTHYLPAFDAQRTRRWVCLEPLDRHHYTTDARACDLVHRMLAAKIAGAEGIFVTDPFGEANGLMHADGTPGELLLPWRTTAMALAGSQHLGSIQLPGGSPNRVFERNGEMTMVVWNDRRVQERMNLGDHLQATDIWGRTLALPHDDGTSSIEAGPLPRFVTGIHPAILRWNMAVQLERSAIPSVFGVTHDNGLTVRNTFREGVGVKARLDLPDSWKVAPRLLDFKMATGEEAVQPFGIALPYDASSGREPVRIDFEVNADQRYTFSVYRHLDVGEGDITLEVASRLNDRGELEVEQFVTNNTDRTVSFKCFLYIPDRRRLMTQVIELTHDCDRKRYRLPDGAQLLGKTLWVRAEEINGNRTFNRRFVAEE